MYFPLKNFVVFRKSSGFFSVLYIKIKNIIEHMFQEPFLTNEDLEHIVREQTGYLYNPEEKAKKLYYWMLSNIAYDQDKMQKIKQGIPVGCKNSLETFYDRKGVCAEQAYLYIILSRLAGLEAFYVHVDETENGKRNHACAAVKLDDKFVYVDPSYYTFDIHHRRVGILSDLEVISKFREYNGRYDTPEPEEELFPHRTPKVWQIVAAVYLGALFSLFSWYKFGDSEKTVSIPGKQLVVAPAAYRYMDSCFPFQSHRTKWFSADNNKDGYLTEYEVARYVEERIEGHTQKSVLDVQPGT